MIYSIFTFLLLNAYLFFLAFIGNSDGSKYKICLFYQLFPFSLYLGLRDIHVGVDTWQYIGEFLKGTGGYFTEPGFRFLGKIIYLINPSSSFYLVCISLIMFGILIYSLILLPIENKYKCIVSWILLSNLVVIFNWVNAIRQGLAALMVFTACIQYINKRNKATFFWLLLAIMFHVSSAVFIPFFVIQYLINDYHQKKSGMLLDIFLLCFAFLSGYVILSRLPSAFTRYVDMGSKFLFVKVLISISFYCFTRYFVWVKTGRISCIWFNIYLYIICLVLFFYTSTEMSNRFLYYLGYYNAPILISLFADMNKYYKIFVYKTTFFFCIIFLNVIYYLMMISSSQFATNFYK